MNDRASAPRMAALQQHFRHFAGRDGRIAFAPGRVNIIGEHTDYTGGFVLPASVALGTFAVAAARNDRIVRLLSTNQTEQMTLQLDVEPERARCHWSDYVAGVLWSLQESGVRLPGADVLVSSDVPLGAGLSSSAALEVSVAYALLAIAGITVAPTELARICQRAENEFVGARCGIMDQFVATHGRHEHALLLDCASLMWRAVPLPKDHRWIVANTMVRHAIAQGEYNTRRAECEEVSRRAAERFPERDRLADLSTEELTQLARELLGTLARRLRHVVTENRRVIEAVEALERGDTGTLGHLLTSSHESLRADFEVSCQELDLMVVLARELPGVLGARMTGGGFGGCTLTLAEAPYAEEVTNELRSRYAAATGIQPEIYVCEFGPGAGVVS